MEHAVTQLDNITTEKSTQSKRNANTLDSPEKDGNPSYTAMIAQAILQTPYKRATLSEIYQFMNNAFEILQKRGNGWRNCVRHTLSLKECFVKLHRPENGRSCNWTVHPSYFEAFSKRDYRKNRVNRKKIRPLRWLEGRSLDCANSLPYLNERDMSLRDGELTRLTSNNHQASSTWQNYSHLESNPPKQHHYNTQSVPSYSFSNIYNDEPIRDKVPQMTGSSSEMDMRNLQGTICPYTDRQGIPTTQYAEYPQASRNNRINSSPIDNRSSLTRYSSSNVPTSYSGKNNQRPSHHAEVHMPYNQELSCQSYGIDPSCYSCFSTRPYRQEFF